MYAEIHIDSSYFYQDIDQSSATYQNAEKP